MLDYFKLLLIAAQRSGVSNSLFNTLTFAPLFIRDSMTLSLPSIRVIFQISSRNLHPHIIQNILLSAAKNNGVHPSMSIRLTSALCLINRSVTVSLSESENYFTRDFLVESLKNYCWEPHSVKPKPRHYLRYWRLLRLESKDPPSVHHLRKVIHL